MTVPECSTRFIVEAHALEDLTDGSYGLGAEVLDVRQDGVFEVCLELSVPVGLVDQELDGLLLRRRERVFALATVVVGYHHQIT